jgi:hypothetical protein
MRIALYSHSIGNDGQVISPIMEFTSDENADIE